LKIVVLISFSFISSFLFAQEKEKIYNSIQLDTLTIFAENEFDIKTFIHRIKDDTTFYQAFINLRYYPHKALGNLWVYNRREKEKAAEKISVIQHLNKSYMWQDRKTISSSGKLRTKKGKYRFTTAEIYYDIFFPSDTIPVSTDISNVKEESVEKSKKSKYIHDLKLMMFNPGEDISGVPIVGKKMSIFDNDMVQYYDYKVSIITFNGMECYQFACVAKPEYKKYKTVIKYLTTVFHKETMMVLNRQYSMRYKSILFQFDVKINVRNEISNGIITPLSISYTGYWDIPFKTQEKIAFTIVNSDYTLKD
jgi:hypothetical protein